MSHQPRSTANRRLLTSCAIGLALVAIARSPDVRAQAIRATPFGGPGGGNDAVAGSATHTPNTAPNTDTVTIRSPTAVINWRPDGTLAPDGSFDFLPNGNTAIFAGAQGFTVLNRILPDGTNPVSINGRVNSVVGGQAIGGNVWFYSPNGVIAGATSVFNVGSLVLTANDIPFTAGASGGISPGTIRFGSGAIATNPGASVIVESGARINAGDYVALVAPRVEQRGSVQAGGGVGYVAAEVADVTINGGLFDIGFRIGSGDANGVVHSGFTGGGDNSTVHMAAVAKNTALTMLVGGSVGYASSATQVGGAIVLSAGYDVANGAIADAPPSGTPSNIAIGGGGYGSPLTARASNALTAQPGGIFNSIEFRGDTTLIGDNSATLRADGRVTALGDLRVLSQGSSASRALVQVDAPEFGYGGLLDVNGSLTVDAGVSGGAEVAGIGRANTGGSAALLVEGGRLIVDGFTSVSANGIGGGGALRGGDGRGGSATLDVSSGSDVDLGTVTVAAGGFANGQQSSGGGDGFGGFAAFNMADGTFDAGSLFVSAVGVGGSDTDAPGGSGFGGVATFALSGGATNIGFVSLDVGATAGRSGGAGTGPIARGGTILASVTGGDTALTFGQISADASARAEFGYGAATGNGATAIGGDIDFDVTGGIVTGLNLSVTANGTGGAGGAGADLAGRFAAGDGTGGTIGLSANAGTVNIGNVALNANGSGGDSDDPDFIRPVAAFAGQGLGGTIDVGLGGGTLTVDTLTLASGGDGGSGIESVNDGGTSSAGGDGFGGTARVTVDDGALFVNGSLCTECAPGVFPGMTIDASGAGGQGGGGITGVDPQPGGFGGGGTAALIFNGGTLQTTGVELTANGFGGFGGRNFSGLDAARGGDGFGGNARLMIASDGFSFDDIALFATGGGGGGGDSSVSGTGTGGQGGNGFGGGARVIASVDAALDDVRLSTNGFGGFGGRGAFGGAGGLGQGGILGESNLGGAFVNVDAGEFTIRRAVIESNGFGGEGGTGAEGIGGIGGNAIGGDAGFSVDGADSALILAPDFESDFAEIMADGTGGAGGRGGDFNFGSGVDGVAGGDGQGGLVQIDVSGGASLLAGPAVDLHADGLGGRGSLGEFGYGVPGGDSGAGGAGSGGEVRFTVIGAGSEVAAFDRPLDWTISALGTGGEGGDFGAEGFNGDAGGDGGAGGAGTGGLVRFDLLEGGSASFGTLILDTSGQGGLGGNAASGNASGGAGGAGGLGQGGTSVLNLAGSAFSANVVLLDANGAGGGAGDGGNGFESGAPGGDGGRGGDGRGGNAIFSADTAQFIVTDATLDGNGFGGSGGAPGFGIGIPGNPEGNPPTEDVPPVNGVNGFGGDGYGGTLSLTNTDAGAPGELFRIIGTATLLANGNAGSGGDFFFGQNFAGRIEVGDSATAPDGGSLRFGSLFAQANGADPGDAGFFLTSSDGALTVSGGMDVVTDGRAEFAIAGDGTLEVGYGLFVSATDILVSHSGQAASPFDSIRAGSVNFFAGNDITTGPGSLVRGDNITMFAGNDITANDLRATDLIELNAAFGSIALRSATVTGGARDDNDDGEPDDSLRLTAGDGEFGYGFVTAGDITITGAVEMSGNILARAGGDILVTGAGAVISDNSIDFESADDIVVASGGSVSAGRAPLTGSAELSLDAGDLAFSDDPTAVASLIVAGTIAAPGQTIRLAGDAIQADGNPIVASSLFARVRNAPDVGVAGSDDGGQLRAECVEGNICLGRLSVDNVLSVSAANRIFIAGGDVAVDNITLDARDGLVIGTAGAPSSFTANESLFLRAELGDVTLNDVAVSSPDFAIFAGGSLLGSGALSSSGDVGIAVGDSVVAASIDAGGNLVTPQIDGSPLPGLIVPGDFLVGSVSVGTGSIEIDAGRSIDIGTATVNGGNDIVLDAGTTANLGNASGAVNIVIDAQAITFGDIAASNLIDLDASAGGISGGTIAAGGNALLIATGDVTADAVRGVTGVTISGAALALGDVFAGLDGGGEQGPGVLADIVLDATGTIDLDLADATRDVLITAGDTSGFGAIDAGRDVRLDASSGDITADSVAAGRSVDIGGDTASSLLTIGALTAGTYAEVRGGAIDAGDVTTGGDAILSAFAGNLTVGDVTAGDEIWLSVFGTNPANTLTAGALRSTGLGDDAAPSGSATFGDTPGGAGPAGNVVRVRGSGAVTTGEVSSPDRIILVSDSGTVTSGALGAANGIAVLGGGDVTVGAITTGGAFVIESSAVFEPLLAADGSYDPNRLLAAPRIALEGSANTSDTLSAGDILIATRPSIALDEAIATRSIILDSTDGFITVESLTAGQDATLRAGGAIDVTSGLAGNLLDFAADGAVTSESLTGIGGVIVSGSTLALGDIVAGREGGGGVLADITIEARGAGDIGVTSAQATRDITITGAGALTAGSLIAGGNVTAEVGNGVTIERVTAVGDALLRATNGDIRVTTDLSAGSIRAFGEAVDLTAIGALTIDEAEATAGDLVATSGGRLILRDGAASGGLTLQSTGADLRVELAQAAGDIALTAATDIVTGDLTTSLGSMVFDAGNSVTAGNLSAGGAATDGQFRPIEIFANGAITVASARADFGDVDLESTGGDIRIGDASAGDSALIEAGYGSVVTGALTAGTFAGGAETIEDFAGGVGVIGAGDVTVASATALGNVGLASVNGSVASGTILAGDNVLIVADDNVALTQVTADGRLLVGNSSLIDGLTLDDDLSFLLTIAPPPTGGTVIAGGALQAREIAIAAGTTLSLQAATADSTIDLLAGGLATLNGNIAAEKITVGSGDLAIGANARIGTAATDLVELTNTNGERRTFIGGIASTEGYSLSSDEMTRLFGTDITIFAPRVGGQGDASVGSSRAPDVIVGAFTLTGRAANAQGQLGAGGTLRIETPGKLRVSGAVSLTGLAGDNRFEIQADDALEVVTDQGSIALGAADAPTGTLFLGSDDVIAASLAAIGDVGTATSTDAIEDRLAVNDGPVNEDGYLRADAIEVAVTNGFYVQNTGAGDRFRDRRGLTVGSGGLSITTEGSTARIVVNGRQSNGASFVTGIDFLRGVEIEGGFDSRSTINGCLIGNPGGCFDFDATPPLPRDIFEEPLDPGGEDGISGSDLPTTLIQLRDFEPFGFEPLIDEPVTGAGNDDFYVRDCEPGSDDPDCEAPPPG